MSVFKKLFGKSKKDKSLTAQQGIQKLREVEDTLKKKSDFVEKKIESQLAIAKKNGTKNKRAALRALKTKKNLERQLQQIDRTLTTLEYQREALGNTSTQEEVVKVLKLASSALEGVHKQLDVDEAHEIMDEAAQQKEIADELASAISNPENIGGDVIDEDELLAELQELEHEKDDKQLQNANDPAKDLPNVPSTELPHSTPNAKTQEKKKEDNRIGLEN